MVQEVNSAKLTSERKQPENAEVIYNAILDDSSFQSAFVYEAILLEDLYGSDVAYKIPFSTILQSGNIFLY